MNNHTLSSTSHISLTSPLSLSLSRLTSCTLSHTLSRTPAVSLVHIYYVNLVIDSISIGIDYAKDTMSSKKRAICWTDTSVRFIYDEDLCTLYTIQCTEYTVHCIMYYIHYTLCIILCTIYNVHWSVYNVHYTLYTGRIYLFPRHNIYIE